MIGDRLKLLRNEKGILQRELAEKLNITQQTISLYESNSREPDNETLIKIADFFNTTTDFLLGRTDQRTPPEQKKKKSREEIEKDIYDLNIEELRIAAHNEGGSFEKPPEGLKNLIRDVIIELRKEKLLPDLDEGD